MKVGLELVPLDQATAFAFIAEHHRTHEAPPGDILRVGATYRGVLIGVATWGRCVAGPLNDGFTAELTRCATDGVKRPTGRVNCEGEPTFVNVASFLEGAIARMVFAAGYRRLVSYILKSERGTSYRAAGWRVVAEVRGRSWNCKSRPRVDKHPTQDKLRLEV